ncbi:RIP metalloprotease RseP [Lagierella sp.]|uniref:RIP metalloprotease RseP n=1 Tax=Lagierella sp. TaxID=2849657 RepID=UPI00260A8725|nr:RIP metalloprotease RseP [Lagierella sp.]
MITIISSLVVFLVVIFIHELGHFFMAVKSGIKVNEFSVGMGPKILQKKKNDINYSLRAIPIGGYVSIEGEDGESSDPRSFANAPAIKRLGVIIAGVIMNFILGLLILIILNTFASYRIVDVVPKSPADLAGIKPGDRIISIMDKSVESSLDITEMIEKSDGNPINLEIENQEGKKTISLEPERDSKGIYRIGITHGKSYNSSDASIKKGIINGFKDFKFYFSAILKGFGQLITGKLSMKEVSGPVGVVKAIGNSFKAGLVTFLSFIALLSINLGIFNILPFPALDGGRAVLILFEMITGKKLPSEKEGILNLIGFIILLGLIIVVTFKDIVQLF